MKKEVQLKLSKSIVASLVAGSLTTPIFAGDFKNQTNGEFATVSGTVSQVSEDAIVVSSAGNNVIVEVDDYGQSQDGYKFVIGDKVIASGRVDHDYLEKKKLEAGRIYIKNLGKMFYSNSADEESSYPMAINHSVYTKEVPSSTSHKIRGKVVATSGREFIVDTGLRKLTVETEELLYNPMDNVGYTQIDVGDRVIVSGELKDKFFEGLELVAKTVSEV